MAQSCFRPIQLYHNYSGYDHTICRGLPTLTVTTSPLTNPILALVEAMWSIFSVHGILQDDLLNQVENLFPGVYTTQQLQVAFQKALSTGLFLTLVPPIRYQCCETEPCVPRFTFSPTMDRGGNAPNPYVAYIYSQVTATLQTKRTLFAQIFKPLLCCNTGYATCSSC